MAKPNDRPLEQKFGILSPSCQISSNIQYVSGLISHYNDLKIKPKFLLGH
jgi:hypothetical protein